MAKLDNLKIFDFAARPKSVKMHGEVDFRDLFISANDTEFFKHGHDLSIFVDDFALLLFFSDQFVPLQEDDFIPVAHISKIMNSESFELLFNEILLLIF